MLDDEATPRNARQDDALHSIDGEPQRGETGLSVPESDPERIAFNLWNEGRVDEAIEFLEREIATRRDARQSEHHADSNITALALIEPDDVEPISDWRERHRSALSPADFNAFGNSVHTIDLVAKPTDAIMPPPPRRSHARVWVMGLGLVVIGLSASAFFWSGRAGAPAGEDTLASAVEATTAVEPASVAPAGVAPVAAGTEVGSAEVDVDVTSVAVDPDDMTPADAEIADAPPPDELPPEDVASSDPAIADGPETTASIGPAPTAEPIVEARLPRQRPEPPADAPRTVAAADPSPPVIYDPSPPPGYAPGPAPFYDPMDPRPTLTPAEYQVLLERRAWAQNYVSRRRAYAERQAMEESSGFFGDPRPVIRLRRN